MSRFDHLNQVMIAQVLTATAVSAHSILKTAGVNLNIGTKMAFMVIPTASAGGDVVATSYRFDFIQSTVTGLTSPDILGSVTVLGSALKVGVPVEVPLALATTKAHLGLNVTVTGGTNPTVTLDAYLVPASEIPQNTLFAKVVDVETKYN